MSKLLPVVLPDLNKQVIAIIKHADRWEIDTAVLLKHVNESDCDWRFVIDNAELSYDWDVLYWEYTVRRWGDDTSNINTDKCRSMGCNKSKAS